MHLKLIEEIDQVKLTKLKALQRTGTCSACVFNSSCHHEQPFECKSQEISALEGPEERGLHLDPLGLG